MDWLNEDPAFANEWMTMMVTFLEKGGHIQIIHNISRNIDEMLFALKVWTPLYLSGKITPYFYPRIRDNVFFRTLFIAPGVAAVLSSSTVAPAEDNMCFLLNDAAAISSAENEMRRLMTQCRPLMSYFRPFEAKQFQAALQSLTTTKEDTLIFSKDAYCLFLPKEVMERCQKHSPSSEYLSGLSKLRSVLGEILQSGKELTLGCVGLNALIERYDQEGGGLELPYAAFTGRNPIVLNRSDVLLLNEEADRLSHEYPNLHILSLPMEVFTMDAWITESHAMIGTQIPSPLIFSITEPRMVGALWEHFERLTTTGESTAS